MYGVHMETPMGTDFQPVTVSFDDGAVWTRESETTISYTGPLGPNRWTWNTAVETNAAWLAVCCH